MFRIEFLGINDPPSFCLSRQRIDRWDLRACERVTTVRGNCELFFSPRQIVCTNRATVRYYTISEGTGVGSVAAYFRYPLARSDVCPANVHKRTSPR